jgi:hypothetical protein
MLLLYGVAALIGRRDMYRRQTPTSFSKAIPDSRQSASIRDHLFNYRLFWIAEADPIFGARLSKSGSTELAEVFFLP